MITSDESRVNETFTFKFTLDARTKFLDVLYYLFVDYLLTRILAYLLLNPTCMWYSLAYSLAHIAYLYELLVRIACLHTLL